MHNDPVLPLHVDALLVQPVSDCYSVVTHKNDGRPVHPVRLHGRGAMQQLAQTLCHIFQVQTACVRRHRLCQKLACNNALVFHDGNLLCRAPIGANGFGRGTPLSHSSSRPVTEVMALRRVRCCERMCTFGRSVLVPCGADSTFINSIVPPAAALDMLLLDSLILLRVVRLCILGSTRYGRANAGGGHNITLLNLLPGFRMENQTGRWTQTDLPTGRYAE